MTKPADSSELSNTRMLPARSGPSTRSTRVCFVSIRPHCSTRSNRPIEENAQNEYYLTDVIELLVGDGQPVAAYCVDDSREVSGVNSVDELEAARRLAEDCP